MQDGQPYDPEAAEAAKKQLLEKRAALLEKIDAGGAQFRHFRGLKMICGSQGKETGRIVNQDATVAYAFEAMGLEVTVAIVNPIDKFCREQGRLIAGARLIREEGWSDDLDTFSVFFGDDNPIVECEMHRFNCDTMDQLPESTMDLLLGTAVQTVRQRLYREHLEKIIEQQREHELKTALGDKSPEEAELKPFPPAMAEVSERQ